MRHPKRAVDRPFRLWRAAVIVDDEVAALHGHLGLDGVRLVGDSVVLHHVLEDVATVRDLFDLGPHAALGVVHQAVDVLEEARHSVFSGEVRHSPLAQVDRGDQRPEVTEIVTRGANIREQQTPHVVDVLAGSLDLHGRDAQPLVEDFRRFASETRRRHAADLADVADRDCEADRFPVDKDRLEERVLGRVKTAAIGIVVQEDIALLEFVDVDLVHARPQKERHAADHRRAEVAGRHQFAARQRETAGEVERLAENRGIGGAHERDAHVAADGDEYASDDVQRNHVHGRCSNGSLVGGDEEVAEAIDG